MSSPVVAPDSASFDLDAYRAERCREVTGESDFQRAVTEAFLRVMRAKRPDLLWSAKPGEIGEVVTDPDDGHAVTDRPTRATA